MFSKHRSVAALVLTLGLALGTAPALSPPAAASPAASHVATATPSASALVRARRLLPASASGTIETYRHRFNLIDPGQYQCGPTEVVGWIQSVNANVTQADVDFLNATGADLIPSIDAAYYGSSADPFYRPALHGQELRKAFTKLTKFWDVQTPGVDLVAMHAETLLDPAKVQRAGEVIFGLDPASASEYAQLVVDYVSHSPGLQYGHNPFFTFGAFTITPVIDPTTSPKIVMGDGLLVAYDSLGLGDVAGRFVLAHEFTHSAQSQAGMYDVLPSTPEETRYFELMADAGASYFASHPQGLSMQLKRVLQYERVAYDFGDCAFNDLGHHGTPAQRARAATWAYQLQEATRPKSRVLGFREFAAQYAAAVATVILPD